MIYCGSRKPKVEHSARLAEVKGEATLASDIRVRLYTTLDQAQAAYAGAPR